MNARHICFVTREFPPGPPLGGIGTYVATIAPALAGRGHRVTVITVDAERHGEQEMLDTGVRVLRLPAATSRAGVRSVMRFAHAAAGRSAEVHRELPIDVIETPEYLAQSLMLKWRLPDVPVVVRHHGGCELEILAARRIPPRDPRWYVLAAAEVAALHRADLATAVSASKARIAHIKHLFSGVDVRVFPNPLPFEPRGGPVSPSSPPTVLFVGRLDHNKRPYLAGRAVAELRRLGWDLRFECIGPDTPARDGGMVSEIVAEAFEPWEGEGLSLRGRRPHEDVKEALGRAIALCLPSQHEGFPMVVAEAMAFGVPVISTRGTVMEEQIEDGRTGFLVNEDEPERGIREALLRLLEDGDLARRISSACLEHARREWAPSVVAKRFEELVLAELCDS